MTGSNLLASKPVLYGGGKMRRGVLILAILITAIFATANAWAIDIMNDPALVGLWLFDEGSGTVVGDASGNGNDGAVNGTFNWESGKFGDCIVATGGGSIDVPASASLDTVVSAMTIAAWFRIDADSDTGIRRPNAYLLEDQSTSEAVPNGFSFRMWTSDGLSPGIYGNTELQQGQWYHIAGTFDGTQMRLYVDGVEETELRSDANEVIDGQWGGDIGTPADALQLKYASETLIGGMDETVLLNRALSAREIGELMAGALNTTAVDSHSKLTTTWAAIKR
jgi:hypothetical protein